MESPLWDLAAELRKELLRKMRAVLSAAAPDRDGGVCDSTSG